MSVIIVLVTSVVVGSILLFRLLRGVARSRREESPSAKGISGAFRRAARRRRVRFRTGKLFDIKFRHLAECYIVDLSETGVRIKTAKDIGPVQVIRFRDDADRVALLSKVVWRNGNEFGLAFLDKKQVLIPGEATQL